MNENSSKITDIAPRQETTPAATSGALARFQPQNFDDLKDFATIVVKSGLCGVSNPADALVMMMTGAELGLSVMQSLRSIHVVKGRPVLSADLMGAVVRRSPVCEYLRVVEMTPERCTIETKRTDDPEPTTMTWAAEDAKRAGLWGKGNWRTYPQAMLKARALSQIARAVYPDALMGVYVEGELDDTPAPAEPSPERVPLEDLVARLTRALEESGASDPIVNAYLACIRGQEASLMDVSRDTIKWAVDDLEERPAGGGARYDRVCWLIERKAEGLGVEIPQEMLPKGDIEDAEFEEVERPEPISDEEYAKLNRHWRALISCCDDPQAIHDGFKRAHGVETSKDARHELREAIASVVDIESDEARKQVLEGTYLA
jgi:hypothetical protein